MYSGGNGIKALPIEIVDLAFTKERWNTEIFLFGGLGESQAAYLVPAVNENELR